MTLIDLGPIGAEPVALAALKGWCRIDRTDEDDLIGALARAARETIEGETRLILARRAFRLTLDAMPPGGWIALPRGPGAEVTAVIGYDREGVPTVYAAEDALLARREAAVTIAPDIAAAAVNGLEIEFTAGFEAGAVPDALREALLRIVAASYDTRAAVPPELQPSRMPSAAAALLAPYRPVRL